jgi:putative signal transducing protein
MTMVNVRESHDEGELALIKSLLDANQIRYFIQNEHFGSLYPGVALSFNTRVVMVEETDAARAKALLSELDASGEVNL